MKHTVGDRNLIDCDLNESFVKGSGKWTLDGIEGGHEDDEILRGGGWVA
jgi:hypothetical protein